MDLTIEDLLALAPEFSDESEDRLLKILDMANVLVPEGLCGDKRNILVLYYAAHILAISKIRNLSGLKEGNLSIDYVKNNSLYGLNSTSYGNMYTELVKNCTFSVITRNCFDV